MMNPESERQIEEERPAILYHASPNREIEKIEPRAVTVRDPEEGPVVFATPDRAAATKFLIGSDDRWSQLSRFGDVHVAVYSDRKRFEEMDKGGSMYALPSEGFSHDPKRPAKQEWVSHDAVMPIERMDFPSALDAMMDAGVQVYFTDDATLKRIQTAPDHGLSIIHSLESENAHRGRSTRELPPEVENES